MSDWNTRIIDAKQKLAAKQAAMGRGTGGSQRSSDRLPPGQRLVDSSSDFPVLDLGIQPEVTLREWSLELRGACEAPKVLDWPTFEALGMIDCITDFHCVTTWSCYDMPWRGVRMRDVLALARPQPAAAHVVFHSYDGYSTNLPLEDCLGDDCLFATHWRGRPMERKHGGPVRGMVPHLYAWKSAKWVKGVEFITADQRGFWEVRGYHNYGDPWLEQRYNSQE